MLRGLILRISPLCCLGSREWDLILQTSDTVFTDLPEDDPAAEAISKLVKADDVVANGGTVTTDAATTVANVTLTGEAPKATISGSVAGDVTAAGGGTTTPPETDPEAPKDPEITKPDTGDAEEDNRGGATGIYGTANEAEVPASSTITADDVTGTENKMCSEHTWDGGTVTAPTCTAAGSVVYKCTNKVSDAEGAENCTATATLEIPALGHSFTKKTVKTQPTCTTEGVMEVSCANEGCTEKTDDEAIAKLDHDFTNSTRYGTDDTQHWKICKYCDATDTKANHTWVKVDAESTEATCLVKGKTVSKCACGAKKTEEVAKKEHAAAADAEWQKDNTKHWHVCATEGCNEKVDEAAHDWSDKNGACKVCSQTCPVDHSTILTTATCPTCGANGTKTPEATTYTITIPNPLPEGCHSYIVYVAGKEVTSAAADTEVVLVPDVKPGYELKSVSYTPDGEAAVTVNARMPEGGDTEVYSFTMPAKNVTVTVEFEETTSSGGGT